MILSGATRFSRLFTPTAALHPRRSTPPPSTALFVSPQRARFRVGTAEPSQTPVETAMDKSVPKPAGEVTADVMTESFGVGYATRSDEEGFGGVYGSNQTLPSATAEPAQTPVETAMDKSVLNPAGEVTADVMTESFGEGYTTRSDDEGFGRIYGSNQTLPSRAAEDAEAAAAARPTTHPHYDVAQGCEVKEKEKARHQTTAHG